MNIIQTIITLGSIFVAILAWIAKLRWSKEFALAKNATIVTKDAQIEQLKDHIKVLQEMTPMKVREYFISVKEQLEEYIEKLESHISDLENQLKDKNVELKRLKELLPTQDHELQDVFLALIEFDNKSILGKESMLKILNKFKDIATTLVQAST